MRRFELVKDAPRGTIKPRRGTAGSAGYDFFAAEDILCPAHGISKLSFTNIKAYMPSDEYLAVMIRSSLAVKYGLQITQGTAVIDSDYADNPNNDGNIGIQIANNSDTDVLIKKGERVCQGIFAKFYITDDDECCEKRSGGYGSTGVS